MQQLVAVTEETKLKTFPASLERLHEMLRFVKDHAQGVGFDLEQASKIELAAEEAIVNIISYGFPNRRGSLEIECAHEQHNAIRIVFIDRGIPYNPLQSPSLANPQAPIELQVEGGYGILLIKGLMDQVEYRRDNGRNVLTLIKKIQNQMAE